MRAARAVATGFGDEGDPADLRARARTLRQQAVDHEGEAARKRADARGLEQRAARIEGDRARHTIRETSTP